MTKLLSQHFRCTVLGIYYLWLYSCSLIAWPKLSCVYCTGKASGWFFRHEMSDLYIECKVHIFWGYGCGYNIGITVAKLFACILIISLLLCCTWSL